MLEGLTRVLLCISIWFSCQFAGFHVANREVIDVCYYYADVWSVLVYFCSEHSRAHLCIISNGMELNWFLANVNSSSCSLYVIDGPSICLSSVVCLSSVTLVHHTQAIEIFGNIPTPCGTLAIHDLCIKILPRSSQGNPAVGGVKHKRGRRI